MVKRINRGKLPESVGRSESTKRGNLKEAESYGWTVNDWEAKEAYEFAIDSGFWNEAQLDSDIVRCLSDETLAKCLVNIFRWNNFRAWEDREYGEDEFEESAYAGRKSRRSMNEEVGYGFVRLGTIDDDAYRSTHKRGYKSFYDSEDGYQQFTKRVGDFSIKIMSTDDPGPSTISVSTQKYDLNKLDRELSDLTFNTEEDLIELERRLSELSGGYRESLNSKRSMNEEIARDSVTLGDIDIHPLSLNGFESYYSSEDGYQDFTKHCGDFTIYIIDSDEPGPATIYIHPSRGVDYDINELDREIGDIVIRNQADLDELESRLLSLSGGGVRESCNVRRKKRARRSRR